MHSELNATGVAAFAAEVARPALQWCRTQVAGPESHVRLHMHRHHECLSQRIMHRGPNPGWAIPPDASRAEAPELPVWPSPRGS